MHTKSREGAIRVQTNGKVHSKCIRSTKYIQIAYKVQTKSQQSIYKTKSIRSAQKVYTECKRMEKGHFIQSESKGHQKLIQGAQQRHSIHILRCIEIRDKWSISYRVHIAIRAFFFPRVILTLYELA